jgi:heptosyltransferase-2
VKILVISLAGIGDTILATPLIGEIRRQFPDSSVDALVLWKASAELLRGNPSLMAVFQRNMLTENKFGSIRFLRSLKKNDYDISINTHPQARVHYRICAALVGARRRLSHSYECDTALDRFLVTDKVPQDYDTHSVDQNLRFLPLLGGSVPDGIVRPELFLSSSDEKFADELLGEDVKAHFNIGIHVGSGGTKNLSLKRWPLDNYAQLIPMLLARNSKTRVLLIGGFQEQALHIDLRARIGKDRLIDAKTSSFNQSAALLKRCSVFISVDTALMHLAAAVQVPQQFVIEAPTLNKTNWPYARDFILIKNPRVAGRNLDYYRYDGRDIRGTREELIRCMNSITPEMVFGEVERALSR